MLALMRGAVAAAALATILGTGAAVAPARAAGPCPYEWPFTQPSRSLYKHVSVPAVAATTAPGRSYDGLVARPKKLPTGTSARHLPGIVILHGRGGNKCSQWWVARLLAGHGFIALVLTVPPGADPGPAAAAEATAAAKAGVKFLRSASDPYRANLNGARLGLVGYSQGSLGVTATQHDLKPVRATVQYDNLRAFALGDPGGPTCAAPSNPVTPRVPSLGVGSETGCTDAATPADKLAGWRAWHAAGIPAMETVLAGVQHPTFNGGPPYNDPAHTIALRRTGYYTFNWFDRWLHGNAAATGRLLSPNPLGAPIDTVLSSMGTGFNSAAFIPGAIDCADLRTCL
jgi:dienelactone hydrolase